tara:strand:- start:181 stop:423 length:243 start_codon:yes stop_codon:yes gene_type:complete
MEEKLKNLPLNELRPPLNLSIVDIDSNCVTNSERIKYDLEVPVMIVKSDLKSILIPRSSPRLDEKGIFYHLQKNIDKNFN